MHWKGWAAIPACAVFIAAGPGLSAQRVERQATGTDGTFEFPQSVMSSPGGPTKSAVLRLSVVARGDSVSATTQLVVEGRAVGRPDTLRGTARNGVLTLISPTHDVKLTGAAEGRVLSVYDEYTLRVTGDEISGEVNTIANDVGVQMMPRQIKGRRTG